MEHYDGPAFFRRQGRSSNIDENSAKKSSNVSSTSSFKKASHKFEGRNIRRQRAFVRTSTTLDSYRTRSFRPTYVPPSSIKFTNKNDKEKYSKLVAKLRLKFNNLWLFTDDFQESKDIVDDNIFEENNLQQIENKNELPEDELETPADSKLTEEINDDNADGDIKVNKEQEISEPTDDKENQGNEETEDINSNEIEVSEDSMEQNDIDTISSEESDDNSMDTVIPYETARNYHHEEIEKTIELKQQDDNAPKKKALDRSLDEIMQQEKNDMQSHLSLFNQSQKGDNKENLMYKFPEMSLLPDPVINDEDEMDEWVLQEVDILNETLEAFHVKAEVTNWTIGPTVTQFEVTLNRGVKVNKITNLTDDLKLALAAKDIRIEAPIPGKRSVGIEIPNKKSRPVMLSEVLNSKAVKEATSPLTVALGVDLFGQPQVTNIAKMPHGLIAGATGSGKSVFINSMLVSLLYKATPTELKLLLIDPKAVEMAPYHDIPHLLAPVVSDPQAATASLKWAVNEMEERFERLAAAGAKNIESYNEKAEENGDYGLKMPYIVIVIDELADLMMVASSEVQDYIIRITQKARAAGIHMIIATQRPSVDVITGVIKSNIPTRIAFMVSSQVDSRTILDSSGAERLLGRGDMLYLGNGESQARRIQGTYVEDEIEKITDFIREQGTPTYAFNPDKLKVIETQTENEDDLMPEILEYIVNEDGISISKLQRVFSIGYNRAAKIIDDLESKQYISSAKGSKPRDVYLTPEKLRKMKETN